MSSATEKVLAPWGDAPHSFGYVLIHRQKKSKPWQSVARFACSGQCCLATAEEHFEKQLGWPEDSIWRSRDYSAISTDEWAKRQAKQHLKSLGYKLAG